MAFEKFSLVWPRGGSSAISVILTDPIQVPCFNDYLGGYGCIKPFDPTNPKEWEGWTFTCQIAWSLTKDKYEMVNPLNYELFPADKMTAYIPWDQATGRIRNLLGLLSVAEKSAGQLPHSDLKKLAETLLDYINQEEEK